MQDFGGIWSGQVLRQPLDPLVMVARCTGYSCRVVNTIARNQKRLPALYNAYDCDGFLTQHQLILVHCRLLSFKIWDLLSQESIGSSIFSKEVSNSSSSVNIRKTRLFIERVLQLNHQIRGGRESRFRVLERLSSIEVTCCSFILHLQIRLILRICSLYLHVMYTYIRLRSHGCEPSSFHILFWTWYLWAP